MPLALTASVLKVWLLENGIDIKTIGLFALVGLPYTFKFAWAPLIDNLKIPVLHKLGRRRSWLIVTQFGLMFCLVGLGYYGTIGDLGYVSFYAVLTAFFSASQDIVIDAYRVESLREDEQGAGAGIYIYGYRVAMLISGAGSLFLAEIMDWGFVYLVMSGIVALTSLVTIIAKEPLIKIRERKDETFFDWLKKSIIEPFADFIKKDYWLVILLFIVFYKFCDAFAGNLTSTFLRDIGFEKSQIAMVFKTFGLVATLIGVLVGGLIVKSISLIKALWIGAILQAISNLIFVLQASIGANIKYLFLTVSVENLTSGIGTSIFLAYLATLCNKKYTATQYALLTSFAVVGRTFLASSAGYFVAILGWERFFIFTTFMAIPSLIFLCWMTRCLNCKKVKLKIENS